MNYFSVADINEIYFLTIVDVRDKSNTFMREFQRINSKIML